MDLFRRIGRTLRGWWDREDAAPRMPPVPGRPPSRAEPGPNSEAGLTELVNSQRREV